MLGRIRLVVATGKQGFVNGQGFAVQLLSGLRDHFFRQIWAHTVFEKSTQVHQPAMKKMPGLFHDDEIRLRSDIFHPLRHFFAIDHFILITLYDQPGAIGVLKL